MGRAIPQSHTHRLGSNYTHSSFFLVRLPTRALRIVRNEWVRTLIQYLECEVSELPVTGCVPSVKDTTFGFIRVKTTQT